MSAPLRIEITENAHTQISVASAWWAENRPAAPAAIREELDRGLGLLRVQPDIGTIARRATLPGVRRVTALSHSLLRVLPCSRRCSSSARFLAHQPRQWSSNVTGRRTSGCTRRRPSNVSACRMRDERPPRVSRER